MGAILTTSNLAVGYGSVRVLSDLNLSLQPASLTCLIGANGAGKSTLLRSLSGRQPILEGSIAIDGCDLSTLSRLRLARLVSEVFTGGVAAGGLMVDETVALGRQPYTGFFGRLSAADREIVDRSLSDVGIESLRHRFLSDLSDGERQKVMIARALAQEAPLMLLDEPTSFLDVASRIEVVALLRDLADRYGKAILLSTHDIATALPMADALWLVADHQLIAGDRDELVGQGAMDRVFSGRRVYFDRSAGDYKSLSNEYK